MPLNYMSCLSLVLGLALLVGCGDSNSKSVGNVSGKVTFNGQPVTGGTLAFVPVGGADAKGEPGKAGGAEVGADGTYKVSTYGEYDGAVVGKHTISYTAPTITDPNATPNDPPKISPFQGLVPKTKEVEVKSGSNTIDIELVKPGA